MTLDQLRAKAIRLGIRVPTRRTLAIYGIDESIWLSLFAAQGWKCGACQASRATWNTDHEHVPGWSKMPAAERARYVRGILCWKCNKFVVQSNLTAETAMNVARYIQSYEERRDA